MIQSIKCKGGKIFAGYAEPYCYEDAEWMKDIRDYVKHGCTVVLIEAGEFKFAYDGCQCGVKCKECKLIPQQQTALF